MYTVDWTESAEQGHWDKERKTVIILKDVYAYVPFCKFLNKSQHSNRVS